MHIPKCGGSTFHKILERIYPKDATFSIEVINNIKLNTDEFIAMSSKEKEKLQLLKGHMTFGLHKHFQSRSHYITFIRNPIERIVSYYYFVKRRPNHRLHKLGLFKQNMTLLNFVSEIEQNDINNGQIRFISGINKSGPVMLERAIDNINKHFSFVGTLEKFDEGLALLKAMYHWDTPFYKITNKTINRPQLDDLDSATLEAIKEFNKEDIILYEMFSNKLKEIIKLNPSIKDQVENIRKLSERHFPVLQK